MSLRSGKGAITSTKLTPAKLRAAGRRGNLTQSTRAAERRRSTPTFNDGIPF